MARVLFHIDLNAFYANAEILRNSSYEGVQLVVSGLFRTRGGRLFCQLSLLPESWESIPQCRSSRLFRSVRI